MGLGGIEAPPPELDGAAAQAAHAWAFCGGWNPQVLPLYAALYPVPDWHLLIELLQGLRNETLR